MTDNLGSIEIEMPDDINEAVERGQRLAEGRTSYNRWILTGVLKPEDVSNLLEFVRHEMTERNKAIDSAAGHESDLHNRIAFLEAEESRLTRRVNELLSLGSQNSDLKYRIAELESHCREWEGDLKRADENLQAAHEDINALARTIRILSRGK